jgi:anion-transporting  ArsA/GET3 family ATPase
MFILFSLTASIVFYYTDAVSLGKRLAQDVLGAFPGIDEAMSFAEVMRYCK